MKTKLHEADEFGIGHEETLHLVALAEKRPVVSYYSADHEVLTVVKGIHGGEVDLRTKAKRVGRRRTGVDYSHKGPKNWIATGSKYRCKKYV